MSDRRIKLVNSDKDEPKDLKIVPASPSFSREQPLVFISHDTRDAELAEAFGRATDRFGYRLISARLMSSMSVCG